MKRNASIATIVIASLLLSTAGAATSSKWYAPLARLPDQPTIRCILEAESHSTEAHPNLGDRDPYQFGPWQFTTILWNRWSWVAGVGRKTASYFNGTTALHAVTIAAYQATLYQQTEVFATVDRYDGLGPWTRYDGC